jgi:drug/metabolite transporter (DMT)-like permease
VAHALSLSVVFAVLLAAAGHAVWNAIAHDITDKLVGFTLVGLGATAASVPLLLFADPPARAAWPYLGVSMPLHIGYNLLLMRAYRLGPFSQVYPLARGTSPLVVTLAATLLLGEIPTVPQLVAILLICAGLGTLVLVGRPGRKQLPAILAAVATGLVIAAYTVIDGVGVRRSGSLAGYAGWLIFVEGLGVPTYALARRGTALLAQCRPVLRRGLAGGALSLTAYALVLWAQTRGALAPIAALRESSIIMGALVGTLLFRERFGTARVVASILVVAGILLLTTG